MFALAEHPVTVPGRGGPSKCDVWALLKGANGLVSLAIEGKAGEPFDKTIEDWLGAEPTANRKARLDGLCTLLGLTTPPPVTLRFQLFHRTAAALIEAERIGATQAVMCVQSFGDKPGDKPIGFTDFAAFVSLFGASAVRNGLVLAGNIGGVTLYLGWADCPVSTDNQEVAP